MLNIITGGDALGPLITSHQGIDKVSFTGSTATGKKVMECASADLKRITLELGGNDAAIVLPDADPKATAAKGVLGRLHQCRPDLHRGQARLCPQGHL